MDVESKVDTLLQKPKLKRKRISRDTYIYLGALIVFSFIGTLMIIPATREWMQETFFSAKEKTISSFGDSSTYYFDSWDEGNEEWTTGPGFMTDNDENVHASTPGPEADIELLTTSTFTSGGSGDVLGVLIRAKGYMTGGDNAADIKLRPVFTGGDGDDHTFNLPVGESDWSGWYNITTDTNWPNPWIWDDVANLDCDVESVAGEEETVYCSKVELKVIYSAPPVNNAPTQSNQKIWNSTTTTEWSLNITGVNLTPTCFNVTIADADADYMNVTILTNKSGPWTIVNQTASGITNGTFNGYNTSWVDAINTTYYISFNVSDDEDWCNETYQFTTVDEDPPIITIHNPIDMIYNTTIMVLDVRANEIIDTWWYDLNSGGNTTFSPNGTAVAKYGPNYLIVYANDTSGNENSSVIYFNTSNYVNTSSVLNEAGLTYYLVANITNSAVTHCIDISANDVIFDGQNYTIDGKDTNPSYAIWIKRTSPTNTNITLKNLFFTDWYYTTWLENVNNNTLTDINYTSNTEGIWLELSSNNTIININITGGSQGVYVRHGSDDNRITGLTATDVTDPVYLINVSGTIIENVVTTGALDGIYTSEYANNTYLVNASITAGTRGIYIKTSDNWTVTNVTVSSNSMFGFYIRDTSNVTISDSIIANNVAAGINIFGVGGDSPILVYNNFFNNTYNVNFTNVYANSWNTTKQSGTRIYSNGTKIGGNYWTNPTGTGYSDTCTDADEDGFADSGYDVEHNDSDCIDTDNCDCLPYSNDYVASRTWSQNTTLWFTGGNVSNWEQNTIFWFTGGNVSSTNQVDLFWFTGGNVSNWEQNTTFWFVGGSARIWNQNTTFWFEGGNISSTNQETIFWFEGGNESSTNQVTTFWFTGGNVSNWQQQDLFWFLGGNVSARTWNQNTTFWFTGGNISTTNQETVFWFEGGNISNWEQETTFWFVGGNNRTTNQETIFWFSGGNISNWQQQTLFWFLGGNVSAVRTWGRNTLFWFLGGNISDWNQESIFWFTGGNVSSTNQVTTFWFEGGNISSTNQVTTFWFEGGSARTWEQNTTFWFEGGNVSTTNQETIFWFTGGNISTTNQETIFWFEGGNESSTNQVTTFWFEGGNISNWQQNTLFWFLGGNETTLPSWSQNTVFYFVGGNVTDWNQETVFWFLGGNETLVITISYEYPENNSNITIAQPLLYFNLTTPSGNLMNYSIYVGNSPDNCNIWLCTFSNVGNGTHRNSSQYYSAINFTTYCWRIQAEDGINMINETFNFTIMRQGGGGFPSSRLGTAVAMGVLAGLAGSIIFGLLFVKKKKERWR